MKFLKLLLQLVGLVKKYEPAVEAAIQVGKPVVEAIAKDVKAATKEAKK